MGSSINDCRDYHRKKNFEVIVGSEIETNFGDVLSYYLTKDIQSREFFSVVDEVRKQNGLIIIPHPFRKSLNKMHRFQYPLEQLKNSVDAIECFNARMLPGDNAKAQAVAHKHNLVGTGGSDAHFWFEAGTAYTSFDGSFRSALKRKKTDYGGTTLYGPLGGLLSFLRTRSRLFKKKK